nr:MAG TPA: intron associated endonuclease [Caudoviricetes sp.]
MSYQNIAKAKAIEKSNRQRLLKINPNLDDESGIYFLTRVDEDNIHYFYIGQALHIMQRMCGHLVGYQHIDLSIKKRGFYSEDNPYGWQINFLHYPKSELDKWEQYWILEYTKKGYQCRYNKTAGGQGQGKEKINEFKPVKGYRDGIKQGKITLARELSSIAEKHLKIEIREDKANNRVSQKQYEKFMSALDEKNYKD